MQCLARKEVKRLILKDDECIIRYKVNEKILEFEKQLIKLFKNNGFRFTGSGYGCKIRDLCFIKENKNV